MCWAIWSGWLPGEVFSGHVCARGHLRISPQRLVEAAGEKEHWGLPAEAATNSPQQANTILFFMLILPFQK